MGVNSCIREVILHNPQANNPSHPAVCHCASCVHTEAASNIVVCTLPHFAFVPIVASHGAGETVFGEVPPFLSARLCQLHNYLEVAGVGNRDGPKIPFFVCVRPCTYLNGRVRPFVSVLNFYIKNLYVHHAAPTKS